MYVLVLFCGDLFHGELHHLVVCLVNFLVRSGIFVDWRRDIGQQFVPTVQHPISSNPNPVPATFLYSIHVCPPVKTRLDNVSMARESVLSWLLMLALATYSTYLVRITVFAL